MRQFWRRWRARWAPPVVELESVRRRLGLVLQAIYDRPFVVTEIPLKRAKQPLASTHGDTVYLPRTLEDQHQYRLLALEQAERAVRGTFAFAPADALERDLYWLREGEAVDAALAIALPGIRHVLADRRAAALAARSKPGRLAPLELDVETMVRQALSADPTLISRAAAADSAEWARTTARHLRDRHGTRARYRAARVVDHWGAKPAPVERPAAEPSLNASGDRIRLPIRSTRAEAGGEGRDADGAVGLTKLPDPQTGATEAHPAGAPLQGVGPGDHRGAPIARDDEPGLTYPEWNHKAEQYRPNAVLVRQCRAVLGDAAWSADMRERHAPLVRRVRQRFELLRARRTRLRQQKDGDELDLAACVRAQVDMRTGGPTDDRLYVAVRPARQPIAIALLADVSGSTDSQVTDTQQVIDVERVALLLAGEALDALGDPYAMLTFASRGTHNVRLTTLKDFADGSGDTVRRRIAAMRPDGNTRLGAAVRHATALLLRQNAGHRLLLILSDGRPSDQDGYDEQYGVEDTRQAILEARAHDVFPFCLTVDREGADYLPHIFGVTGHTILRHADQLPVALLTVVRQLLAS